MGANEFDIGANEFDLGANGCIGFKFDIGANEFDIGANDHRDKRLKFVIFVEKTGVLW